MNANRLGDQMRRKQARVVLAEEGDLASRKRNGVNKVFPLYKVIVIYRVVDGPAHFYCKSDTIMSVYQRLVQRTANKVQHDVEIERSGLPIFMSSPKHQSISAHFEVGINSPRHESIDQSLLTILVGDIDAPFTIEKAGFDIGDNLSQHLAGVGIDRAEVLSLFQKSYLVCKSFRPMLG